MERLRDNDEDWGLTRIAYAALTKRRIREKFRRRRKTASTQRRTAIAVPDEAPVAVHYVPCGMWAYQVRRHDCIVTLPWVSILGGSA